MTETAREFVITLGAQPGTLATFLRALARDGVNIRGGSGYNVGDYDIFRLITSDPARTEVVLKHEGIPHRSNDVLVTSVPDRPGEFLKLAERLGASGVNIHAVYNVGGALGGATGVAFSFATQDLESARKALGG